jgi:hypothetical protein
MSDVAEAKFIRMCEELLHNSSVRKEQVEALKALLQLLQQRKQMVVAAQQDIESAEEAFD